MRDDFTPEDMRSPGSPSPEPLTETLGTGASSEASRVLVIRLGAMGDLIHMASSLRLLHRHRPEWEIHVLTRPGFVPFISPLPGVSQAHGWNPKGGWGEHLRVFKGLRQMGFAAVVNLHPSLKTHAMSRLLMPRLYGVYRKEKLAMTGLAQRQQHRRHAVEDFYKPFQEAFQLPPATLTDLRCYYPPPSTVTPASKIIGKVIGMIPGVGLKRANRAWPLARYFALAEALLQDPEISLHVFGGADEVPLAEGLVALSPERITSWCGKTGLLEMVEGLSHCRVVVGGDTGPTHVAAALGVPVVSPFAPTNPQRTAPLGPHVQVFTPPQDLACWPCEKPTCPLSGDEYLQCWAQLPWEPVYQAVTQALKNKAM